MRRSIRGAISVEAAIILPGLILVLCMFAKFSYHFYVDVKLIEAAAANADIMTNEGEALRPTNDIFVRNFSHEIEQVYEGIISLTVKKEEYVQKVYAFNDFKVSDAVLEEKDIWGMEPIERGWELQYIFNRNLPKYFPCIARFDEGVATSIKSIDVTSKSYQKLENLKENIEKALKQLDKFSGGEKDGVIVGKAEIKQKVLNIIIPKNVISEEQRAVIEELRVEYVGRVDIRLSEYGEKES